MPDPAEATRLYQAALEERRIVRDRADGLIASEAVEALEHIDAEVDQTYAVLMEALYA